MTRQCLAHIQQRAEFPSLAGVTMGVRPGDGYLRGPSVGRGDQLGVSHWLLHQRKGPLGGAGRMSEVRSFVGDPYSAYCPRVPQGHTGLSAFVVMPRFGSMSSLMAASYHRPR